jgi:hypothetical protein
MPSEVRAESRLCYTARTSERKGKGRQNRKNTGETPHL